MNESNPLLLAQLFLGAREAVEMIIQADSRYSMDAELRPLRHFSETIRPEVRRRAVLCTSGFETAPNEIAEQVGEPLSRTRLSHVAGARLGLETAPKGNPSDEEEASGQSTTCLPSGPLTCPDGSRRRWQSIFATKVRLRESLRILE